MLYFSDSLRVAGHDDYNVMLQEFRRVEGETPRHEWCFMGYFPTLDWLFEYAAVSLKVRNAPSFGLLSKTQADMIKARLEGIDRVVETHRLKNEVVKWGGSSERMKAMWEKRRAEKAGT